MSEEARLGDIRSGSSYGLTNGVLSFAKKMWMQTNVRNVLVKVRRTNGEFAMIWTDTVILIYRDTDDTPEEVWNSMYSSCNT